MNRCYENEKPYRNMCMNQNQIIETPCVNVVEKCFNHDVVHIVPVHTHVINKHIYNHSYVPEYSVSEENVNIDNRCGDMK